MLFTLSVLLLLLLALAVTFVFFGVGWARILQDESNFNKVRGQRQKYKEDSSPPFNCICPAEKAIAPCRCYLDQNLCHLDCEGGNVTQPVLTTVMTTVRQVNKVGPSQILSLGGVYLHDFTVFRMNLSPFLNTSMTYFMLGKCANLTSISGPENNNNDDIERSGSGLIQAQQVALFSSALGDQGAGDFLKYFEPKSVALLKLSNNQITGGQYVVKNESSTEVEFLPGLSRFTALTQLELSKNLIQKLEGGQFRRNVNLKVIMLDNNNLGRAGGGIGRGAFEIGGSSAGIKTKILLGNCNLKADTFSRIKETGLLSPTRSFSLFLEHNSIFTLLNASFGQFLRVNRNNNIDLHYNLLYCDRRLSWLRHDRRISQNQVTQAYCSNDRGRTLWNSALIP